jgi:hypothetical protein
MEAAPGSPSAPSGIRQRGAPGAGTRGGPGAGHRGRLRPMHVAHRGATAGPSWSGPGHAWWCCPPAASAGRAGHADRARPIWDSNSFMIAARPVRRAAPPPAAMSATIRTSAPASGTSWRGPT